MSGDASHDTQAGRFPEVEDEAAKSAAWLPWLGLGLIVLALGYAIVARSTSPDTDASPVEAQAGVE